MQEEGAELCSRGHFASSEIAGQLEDLASEWQHLQDTSGFKKQRLQEANEALIFLHGLDEFDSWLEEVEKVLESADHGKDLNSVSKLLKKVTATEADILGRREPLRQLEEQFGRFQSSNHFMLVQLEQRFSLVLGRYEALAEPVQIRRENLEDSLQLHQVRILKLENIQKSHKFLRFTYIYISLKFNRAVADETIWLEEKLPLAASSHLGSSLGEVQALQQKHAVLQSEIHSHDKVVQQLTGRADQMVRGGHFAAEDITDTTKNFRESYTRLCDLSSLRGGPDDDSEGAAAARVVPAPTRPQRPLLPPRPVNPQL